MPPTAMPEFVVSKTTAHAIVYTAVPRAEPRWRWAASQLDRAAFAVLTVVMVSIILGSEFLDYCRGKETRALGEMDDEGEA